MVGLFAESKVLVGGFYVIDVASFDEAVECALRCPTGLGLDDVLEIRQLTGEDDVPPQLLDLVKRVAPTWSATFVRGGRVWPARAGAARNKRGPRAVSGKPA